MFYKIKSMQEFLSGEIISDEDTKVLIKAYQNGYTGALEPLIRSYSRLIIKSIPVEIRMKEYADDWFQDGVVTLIRSANEFNTDAGTRFSTYLTKSLKNNYTHSKSLFSLPCYLWKYVSLYKKLMEKNPNISDDILISELDISANFLNTVKYAAAFVSSTSTDDYSDVVLSANEDDIAPMIIKKIDYSILSKEVFESLDHRTSDVLKKRYGFYDNEYTLEKIGNEYNMTRQGVDILIHRTFNKLKNKKVLKELAKEYLNE